jgi:hypothetical protein
MPTLVLTRRYSQDSNSLWRAALDAGWDVERLQTYQAPAGLGARDPVFYGETLWADAITGALGLALLQPTADFLPRLPIEYRSRQVSLCALGAVRARAQPAFLKAPDEKLFQARVYAPDEDPAPDLPGHLPVLCAEVVRFTIEFRVFVCERSIAALSPYIRGGEIARDPEGNWAASPAEWAAAQAFTEQLLGDAAVSLPPATVIDVGELASGAWAVVEANAAWASGLCGCDPRQVLRVLRRASVPVGLLTEADHPWVREVAAAAG